MICRIFSLYSLLNVIILRSHCHFYAATDKKIWFMFQKIFIWHSITFLGNLLTSVLFQNACNIYFKHHSFVIPERDRRMSQRNGIWKYAWYVHGSCIPKWLHQLDIFKQNMGIAKVKTLLLILKLFIFFQGKYTTNWKSKS